MVHPCSTSIQEAKAGEQRIQDKPGLQSEKHTKTQDQRRQNHEVVFGGRARDWWGVLIKQGQRWAEFTVQQMGWEPHMHISSSHGLLLALGFYVFKL